MTIHFIIVLIIIFLFSIAFISISIYNKFQDYIIRINEVENKIDNSLREKFDITINLNNIIKEKIKTKKELVDDISNLKEENISSFDMDRKLIEAINKVNFVKENYNELDDDEVVLKFSYNIEDLDEELKAYKKFYNETISSYNKLIRKFPYNIVAKLFKYKEKMFFDGKDMYDDNINDFKL